MGQGVDKWLWQSGTVTESFRVCDLRRELDCMPTIPETRVLKWISWLPKKINCFLWRVVLDGIPTREALATRRVPISSIRCVMCSRSVESADHLLISCEFAHQVWVAISQWIKVPMPRYMLSVIETLEYLDNLQQTNQMKRAAYLIVATACWSIWLARNQLIFKGTVPQLSKIVGEIKALSFLWINSRVESIKLDWKEWKEFKVAWASRL
ncbi:uncharacterized protein LOC110943597 [Helianthus annuus]|uniref:uncharacterized protein LOC110943597 n=1 Tax=Helianthus annuus TaxID=4232 RepID=UPI000B9037DF|nr:uncharacterized protein LOC110943597 [Helianthus annuus]